MTGLTIMLFGFAGVLLICATVAIYVNESRNWRVWWRPDDEGPHTSPLIQTRPLARSPMPAERAAIHVAGFSALETQAQGLAFKRQVFKYTTRRPRAAVRRTTEDLGGYSDVSIQLYDRSGNRLTVRQKVRLN